MLGKAFIVKFLARGIHHHIKPAIGVVPRDHQIIENAAFLIENLRVTLLAWRKPQNISRHNFFHGAGSFFKIAADDETLPHVGNIKQPGVFARPIMFGHHAGWILHRHFIASKRHKLGAQGFMGLIEGGALKDVFGQLRSPDKLEQNPVHTESAPSVRNLRVFTRTVTPTRPSFLLR